MKLPILACVFFLINVIPALAADSFEVNPAEGREVVFVAWGDAESEFTWRGENWGVDEVARFGAFAVDKRGWIYITDEAVNSVKVFNESGEYVKAIKLNVPRNLVDDLLVDGNRIYWLREWPGVPMRVYFVEEGSTNWGEIEVSTDYELTTDYKGKVFSENCWLIKEQDGVGLFAKKRWLTIPLVINGTVIPTSEQVAHKRTGYPVRDGRLTRTEFKRGGKNFDHGGHIVLYRDSGDKKAIDTGIKIGPIVAISKNFFLVEDVEQVDGKWFPFWILYDVEGTEISRTRMPISQSSILVETARTIRLRDDGTWYHLSVDQDGVHVLCYGSN